MRLEHGHPEEWDWKHANVSFDFLISWFCEALADFGPRHYIEEVQGVQQIMDQEEEIAMKEFAKFEEKLRQQKGPDAAPSTVSRGGLDTVKG